MKVMEELSTLLNLKKFPNFTLLQIQFDSIESLSVNSVHVIVNSLAARKICSQIRIEIFTSSRKLFTKCGSYRYVITSSLMYNKVPESLYILNATLKSADTLADFIITNKTIHEIRLTIRMKITHRIIAFNLKIQKKLNLLVLLFKYLEPCH